MLRQGLRRSLSARFGQTTSEVSKKIFTVLSEGGDLEDDNVESDSSKMYSTVGGILFSETLRGDSGVTCVGGKKVYSERGCTTGSGGVGERGSERESREEFERLKAGVYALVVGEAEGTGLLREGEDGPLSPPSPESAEILAGRGSQQRQRETQSMAADHRHNEGVSGEAKASGVADMPPLSSISTRKRSSSDGAANTWMKINQSRRKNLAEDDYRGKRRVRRSPSSPSSSSSSTDEENPDGNRSHHKRRQKEKKKKKKKQQEKPRKTPGEQRRTIPVRRWLAVGWISRTKVRCSDSRVC